MRRYDFDGQYFFPLEELSIYYMFLISFLIEVIVEQELF
jgi:hypothetical protein